MADYAGGELLSATASNNAHGAAASDTQITAGTSTSGSFTATLTGGTAAGVVFTTPTSGLVVILYNTLMQNSGANFTYFSPQIRTGSTIGSGTIVAAASDDTALTHHGTNALRYGGSQIMVLTALTVYNVQLLHRVTAGTGTWSRKHVIVLPTS